MRRDHLGPRRRRARSRGRRRSRTRLNAVDAPTPPAPPTIVTFTRRHRPAARGKSQIICVYAPRCAWPARCATRLRRPARARADDALREPRLDRDPPARRPAGRPALRARAARGARSSAWRRAGRSARGEPALAILHTTAGLGNAVGALATARVNRAPLVVLVGQQDRRHLAFEPFLAGRLARARRRVPGVGRPAACGRRTCRARSRAPATRRSTGRGPALVIVPMDDWARRRRRPRERAAPARAPARGRGRRRAVAELAALLAAARLAGARRRRRAPTTPTTWAALVALAERLRCPVWQEPFGARAGLPAGSPALRRPPARRPHAAARDARAARRRARRRRAGVPPVPVRRRARWSSPGRASALVSNDPAEAHRSPADLALLAPPGRGLRASSRGSCRARDAAPPAPFARPRRACAARRRASRSAPVTCSPALAERLPRGRDPDRGDAVEPARAARAHPRARAARLPQRGDGRARVRASGRDRPADGAARPAGRRRSSATARRSTRSRRSGAPRTTAPARCS